MDEDTDMLFARESIALQFLTLLMVLALGGLCGVLLGAGLSTGWMAALVAQFSA